MPDDKALFSEHPESQWLSWTHDAPPHERRAYALSNWELSLIHPAPDARVLDVGALPYGDGAFDLVTAFETVYFWPDLEKAFQEILRTLKPGGRFLLVCETDDAAALPG